MNENKSIPLPPGITRIIPKDDMRTPKDRIGITPAKCFRDTGIVWTNNNVWPMLDKATQTFILGHEGKHISANTESEFEADAGAFDWCMKNGIGLSKTIHALTRVLSYPEDNPMQRGEQEARTLAMTKRALEYDWKINGNEEAKKELMKTYNTPGELESHFIQIGAARPIIQPGHPAPRTFVFKAPISLGGTNTSIAPHAGFNHPVSHAKNPFTGVIGRPISPFPVVVPVGLTPASLEAFLTQAPARPAYSGGGGGGGSYQQEDQRYDESGSREVLSEDEQKKADKNKILGMPKWAFFTGVAVLVIAVVVFCIYLAKKKK